MPTTPPVTRRATWRSGHLRHHGAHRVGPHELLVAAPKPSTGTGRAGWIVTIVLTVVAGLTRMWNLGSPTDAGTPIFDEKHYAPQAWQMLRGGWVEDNPGYELVVHPPLAKQLIAVGEAAFGYTAWGWRISAAVFGTVLVALVIRIAIRMTGSALLGAVAGILLIADAATTVASRTALLDIFMTVFVVAAFAALIRDREQVLARMAVVVAEDRIADSVLGPRLGFRWWRFSAGVLLGLACAAKWGGLYYIAAFGLLTVASDALIRRRHGVTRPWAGALVRDTPAALASLVLVPIGVYLASFWAWLSSETSVNRHIVGDGPGMRIGADSAFGFVPDALRSLWYYHAHVLSFHAELTNSAGNRHPWESKPFSWPMSLRPLLYYYSDGGDELGCGAEQCVRAVMMVGTPALWWLALPVLAWALWRTVTRADWRYGWILVGYAAGIVPWLASLDRQMYFFYAVPLAPFLVLAMTMVLGEVLGPARARAPRPVPAAPPATGGDTDTAIDGDDNGAGDGDTGAPVTARVRRWAVGRPDRRTIGAALVSAYLALVVVNYIWLWPILTGVPISAARWQAELWLPSWR